jgi:hypothetical protein
MRESEYIYCYLTAKTRAHNTLLNVRSQAYCNDVIDICFHLVFFLRAVLLEGETQFFAIRLFANWFLHFGKQDLHRVLFCCCFLSQSSLSSMFLNFN